MAKVYYFLLIFPAILSFQGWATYETVPSVTDNSYDTNGAEVSAPEDLAVGQPALSVDLNPPEVNLKPKVSKEVQQASAPINPKFNENQEEKKKTAQKTEDSIYDPIPKKHLHAIANRLAIIQKIILRHGRAYDYRVHTKKELNAILSQLDQKKSNESVKNSN